MSPLKLPKMDEKEIKQVLQNEKLCRIAFIDDKYPYISPFQYIYLNDKMYFHFTDYGKKKKILEKNTNVCVSIEHLQEDLSAFSFISIQGKLTLVEDEKEKINVLKNMVKIARKTYSQNFLAAHGFEKEKGWEAINNKSELIYKFVEMREPIGLKSP
jgi:nitroimidazol reductase NimA-like FMN-containing flavoprotein (pyridoxamine 5'-phosphate oxidase superfamily)